MQFVEIDLKGQARMAGYAPYLDYRPATEDERSLLEPHLAQLPLRQDLESVALSYAIQHIVPQHFGEVRRFREELVAKTVAAVKERLTKEIAYWDHRAEELKAQEDAGRQPRMNWQKARERADELQARLQKRMEELEQERAVSPLPPVVLGGALVVPVRLLARLGGDQQAEPVEFARETARVAKLAMGAVMAAERRLGFEPTDVSHENRGYDIESRIPGTGKLRFLEVKGRMVGARTVTITRNEILTGLNKPEDFILALVEVDGDAARPPRYVHRPFQREPDFGVTSVNYDLDELLVRAEAPA